MPQVEISRHAQGDLYRLHRFLAARDPVAAGRAVKAIDARFQQLRLNAAIGRNVEEREGLRELVISFGATGYVALYRYDDLRDIAVILAIRHQREAGYPGDA